MTTVTELQRDYDDLVGEVDDLGAAIAATELDAAAARRELDELTDGASVLQAMAEERAAKNRLTMLRRQLTEAQTERRRAATALERARLAAVSDVVDGTKRAIGSTLVDAYKRAVVARGEVEAAQREVGISPVDSPFDPVCAALEAALRAVGCSVLSDSSRSVTVRYGDFVHVRRPIGWTAPPTPRKFPKVQQDDLETLKRQLARIRYAKDDD